MQYGAITIAIVGAVLTGCTPSAVTHDPSQQKYSNHEYVQKGIVQNVAFEFVEMKQSNTAMGNAGIIKVTNNGTKKVNHIGTFYIALDKDGSIVQEDHSNVIYPMRLEPGNTCKTELASRLPRTAVVLKYYIDDIIYADKTDWTRD
jgi:hypothetical protein